jgi:hypothetical protein
MSSQFTQLGPHAAVDVNGQPFDVVSGQYRIVRDLVDTTTTEDGSKTTALGPQRQLEASFVAHRASDVDYHAAPTDITSEDGISLAIWPNGRGDPDGPISAPSFMCNAFTGTYNVQGSAAQDVTAEGKSNGDIVLPGE